MPTRAACSRSLLVLGARAVLNAAVAKADLLSIWAHAVLEWSGC